MSKEASKELERLKKENEEMKEDKVTLAKALRAATDDLKTVHKANQSLLTDKQKDDASDISVNSSTKHLK